MKLFEILDIITDEQFEIDKLNLPAQLLLETIPEIYYPIQEHIQECKIQLQTEKVCLYVDNNSYVLKKEDSRIQLIYIKSLELKNSIIKQDNEMQVNKWDEFHRQCFLNYYTLITYANCFEQSSLISFTLELYNTVEIDNRNYIYYYNHDVLNWIMVYWKDYINNRILKLTNHHLTLGEAFKSDLKEHVDRKKLRMPPAKEILVDYKIIRNKQ